MDKRSKEYRQSLKKDFNAAVKQVDHPDIPKIDIVQNPRATNFEMWDEWGIPAYYVRFHQPVPPSKNKNREPVSEFYIKGPTGKYLVQSLTYTPHGLIFKSDNETNIVPLANIIYCRLIM